MAGPSELAIREPAVAGMFYPAEPDACRTMARQFLGSAAPAVVEESTRPWLGGVVPHAGWICSGAIAGTTISTLAAASRRVARVDLIVIFGAVHTPETLDRAALDSYARWREPGGACEVGDEIRRRVRESPGGGEDERFRVDDRFHEFEHAVEVELPLVQEAWPGASILPVEVPLIDDAVEIGRTVARRAIDSGINAIYLASSDLTHYGPAYRFAPAGVGENGLAWAKENDRRLLERIEGFQLEQIVQEVRENANACGGGAIAAMMAACRELGGSGAAVLRHANSYETLSAIAPSQSPDNAVGYAAVVVR